MRLAPSLEACGGGWLATRFEATAWRPAGTASTCRRSPRVSHGRPSEGNPLNDSLVSLNATYNVYRNGVEIGQTDISQPYFLDTGARNGYNTYTVKAQFLSAALTHHYSDPSDGATIDNSDVYGLVLPNGDPSWSYDAQEMDWAVLKNGEEYANGTLTINWTQDGYWDLGDLNYNAISSGWSVDLTGTGDNHADMFVSDSNELGNWGSGITFTGSFYDNADSTAHTLELSYHYSA